MRDKLEQYEKLLTLRDSIVDDMNKLLADVKDAQTRRQLRALVNEIADYLSIATVDRLAAFHRLAGDPTLLAEQKLALAVSGWLIGGNEAVDNIQTALSLAETRAWCAMISQPKCSNGGRCSNRSARSRATRRARGGHFVAHEAANRYTPQSPRTRDFTNSKSAASRTSRMSPTMCSFRRSTIPM